MRWLDKTQFATCPHCERMLDADSRDYGYCPICPDDPNDSAWHVGPRFQAGVPLYEGSRHIATFFGDRGLDRARRAAAVSP